MSARYTVTIYTPQELNHASYVQTGLFEMESQGVLKVKVKLSVASRRGRIAVQDTGAVQYTNQLNPKVSYYELLDHTSHKRIRFATDLYDHADQFSEHAFLHCDYVFKRSFEQKYVDKLPQAYQDKLFKLGLCFGVSSPYKKQQYLFFTGLMFSNLLNAIKFDRRLLIRVYNTYTTQIKHWKFVLTARDISHFNEFIQPTHNSVFFQTRCFVHEQTQDVKSIHKQRYRIIKVLREAFPDLFLGGFVPSPVVLTNYSDAVTNVPTEPMAYLQALKQAKIVVYTRGLANSPAWKMAEYLSQAKIIIAERLTAELPVPLTDGQHVLYFNTDEELVAKIKHVLQDADLAKHLSQNGRSYFEKYVNPERNIERIINFMISKHTSS
ncbi:glycosyltransferase [Formosa sp. A9]|uniref:glycosyltransferase n=1 Tax=Formosa sp. A9 TaxID=3442641 RepID=UPI003EBFD501